MNSLAATKSVEETFFEPRSSQEDFIVAMEADCQRRAAARKERHRKANLVKEQGNEAYNDGRFEEAVKLYTDAMQIAKDLTPLYTNRAATYLKLQKFQEAIDDCEFSLRIDEKWVKAFVFKGRALQKMKRFDEAIQTFKAILVVDGKKSKMVEGYIAEVLEERREHELETHVRENLAGQSPRPESIGSVIKTLQSRMEDDVKREVDASATVMYYAGGLRVIQAQLVDDEARTLFRTEGGFNLFHGPGLIPTLLRARLARPAKKVPHHTSELLSAAVNVAAAACTDASCNLKLFLSISDIPQVLLTLFEWRHSQLKRDLIMFFHEASLNAKHRSTLYSRVDCGRLFAELLKPCAHKADVNSTAAATLYNLSMDKKCQQLLEDKFEDDMTSIFVEHMSEVGKSDYEALTLRLRCLVELTGNRRICDVISNSDLFRSTCVSAMERCVAKIRSGLVHPCSFDELLQLTLVLVQRHHPINEKILPILSPVLISSKQKDLLAHVLSIVGVLLGNKHEDLSTVLHLLPSVKKLYGFIKHDDIRIVTYSLKILSLLGRHDPKLLESLVNLDAGFAKLLDVLHNDSSDAAAVNQSQACLLLAMLSTCQGGLEKVSDPGRLVRHLLVLCRESPNKSCRANSAIALGRMAVADGRFLQELRNHDGVNILARHKPEDDLLSR